MSGYFNPRPPREGGDEHIEASHGDLDISIHAPREGGDSGVIMWFTCYQFSIHAPREGGDINEATTVYTDSVFQSTPPARGATSLFNCA